MLVGTTAFFLFGLMGSFHCLGMCGPISMLFLNQSGSFRIILYHLGRIISYSIVELIVFFFGSQLAHTMKAPYHRWIVVGLLLLYAFGWTLPLPQKITTWPSKLLGKLQLRNLNLKALLIGLLSPLLPCGLLYGAIVAGLAAPNVFSAMMWIAAFTVGTIPFLALGQLGLQRISSRVTPQTIRWISRGLALFGALFFIYMYWSHHH